MAVGLMRSDLDEVIEKVILHDEISFQDLHSGRRLHHLAERLQGIMPEPPPPDLQVVEADRQPEVIR